MFDRRFAFYLIHVFSSIQQIFKRYLFPEIMSESPIDMPQFDANTIELERTRLRLIDRIICNRGVITFDDLYNEVRRDHIGRQQFNTPNQLREFVKHRSNIFTSKENVDNNRTMMIGNRTQTYRRSMHELVTHIIETKHVDCRELMRYCDDKHSSSMMNLSELFENVDSVDDRRTIDAFIDEHATIFIRESIASDDTSIVKLASNCRNIPSLFIANLHPGIDDKCRYADRSVQITTIARVDKVYTNSRIAHLRIIVGRCNGQRVYASRHDLKKRSTSLFDELHLGDKVCATH